MTPCSIEPGLPIAAVNEFMSTLRGRVSKLDISLLANELNDIASLFFSNYKQEPDIFAQMIKESIEKSKLPWKSTERNNPLVYLALTNIDVIKSFINDNTNKDTEASTEGSKEAALDDPEAAAAPKKRNFITDAYKTSVSAKAAMERTFLEGMLHSLLFNGNTFTQTTYLLNQNIKAFLNELFKKIVTYLNSKGKDYELPLYDEEGRYVGDFDKFKADYANDLRKLLPFATALETEDSMTVSRLDFLATSVMSASKMELDAYNAFFILTYFDDLLKIYIEPIEITNSKLYNSFKTNNFDKYHIGETSRIEEGWQDLDREIDITELISLINKMLIEQIPVYTVNHIEVKDPNDITRTTVHTTTTRTNQNVKLADFLRIITTIKKIAHTKEGHRQFTNLRETVKQIFGKEYDSLFELIGDLNNDPNNNLRGLFKLFSTYEFSKEYLFLNLGFSFNDENLIYSIYRGCFELTDSDNEEPSIYQRFLNDPSPTNSWNYYSYITLTCVSVESFLLQQYLSRQGVIENTTLKDSQNKARSSHLERSISQNFSSLRPIDFLTEYIDKYAIIDPETHKPLDKETFLFSKSDDKLKLELNRETGQIEDVADATISFNFRIPVSFSYYDVTVYPKSPKVFLISRQGTAIDKNRPFTKEDLEALIPFINDFLPTLGIDSIDSNFIVTYYGAVGDYDTITRNLMHLASHVFMNASMVLYIKSKNPQSTSDYYNYLKEYYGANPSVKLNQNEPGGGFRSLVATQLDYLMDEISRVYNQSQGIYGDGIVKDSEGKMINQVGSSMLATKIEQLVVTLNLQPGSASKHFSLWKGLYRGMQFTREFAGESSTLATKFNVKEHTIASLVYDFLTAYTDPTKEASIMPSILSDKSRILKILLDLNEFSRIPTSDGKGFKKYRDLNTDEWKQIINIELGTFYYKVFLNVTETFDKLQKASTLVFNIKGVRVETPFTFDYWNNFTTFNRQVEELNELLRNDNRKELSVQDILHAILLNPENQGIELTDQIHYVINKNKLQLNQLVLSELKRFTDNDGNMHIDASAFDINSKEYLDFARFVAERYPGVDISTPNGGNTQALMEHYNKEYSEAGHYFDYKWYLEPSGNRVSRNSEVVINISEYLKRSTLDNAISRKVASEINSEQFWKIKQNDLVKDLLSNNCIIRTTNTLYEDLTSSEHPERLQPLLRCLKYGTFNPSRSKSKNDNQDRWYKSGTGWIALARLTYKEPKLDDDGNPVLENGAPVIETKHYLIASESDVRRLSYKKDGRTISYGDSEFNFYDLVEDKENNYTKFELNPCIETWNTVDFLMGLEFMNSTVGTHLNHPAKKNLNGGALIEEAERWLAQVKRNVSLSATKHSFALNLLNGIRDTYRIAVVEDDVANVYNIFGEQNKKGAKPFDGATFVCGTNNYLENFSLGANAAGTNKKQFIHSYKQNSGTGIIIKTAGFPITNAKINQCEFYRRMNKKMMEGKWQVLDPNNEIDITVDYFGNTIDYDSYYFMDGKYYRIQNIEKIGKNKYKVYRYEVNEYGEEIAFDSKGVDYEIDNNWALWNMFGGSHSKSLVYDSNLGRNVLKDSESSFQNVVLAMNSVSEKRFDEFENPPTSQKQVHQNLKYSNIDYVVTAGAIKQGAANINSRRAYYDDDYKLTTMEVSMHDSGIQLDAEHHADESTLSLMTLVVNALCARGYSLDRSNEVYEALYNLTVDNLRPHLEGLSKYLDATDESGNPILGDKEALLDSVAGVILKGLRNITDREGNLVQAVSEVIILAAKEGLSIKGKDLEGVIPFSHPAMYKLLTSMLSSAFTREGIRIKFNGSLAVLNPSNGIWTIYGDCLLHDFDPDVTKENKTNLQKRMEVLRTMPIITEFSKLRLGYRYFIYYKGANGLVVRDSELLDDPKKYWIIRKRLEKLLKEGEEEIARLKEQLDAGEISQEEYETEARKNRVAVQENIIDGRDLATYQADFQGTIGDNPEQKTYNIWDLDVVKFLYAYKELSKIIKDNKSGENLSVYEMPATDKLMRSLRTWCLDYMPENYQLTSLISVLQDFANIAGLSVNELDNAEKLLRRRLQNALEAISTGVGAVQIGGLLVEVAEGSVNVYPYELIMPKIYATRFGLLKGDSLHDVMKLGANFFKDRILSKSRALITDGNLFDIELKRTDGKHVYILYKDGDEFVDLSVRNEYLKRNLTKVPIQKEQDGYSWWRTDYATGERMMQLSSLYDEVYSDGDNEIIVTDNPKFFLETQSYYQVSLSSGVYGMSRYKASPTQVYTDLELNEHLNDPLYVSERVQDLIVALKEVDNQEAKDYIDYLGTVGELGGETLMYKIQLFLLFANDPENSDKSIESFKERARWYRRLDRISNQQFLAFKESLKILAARIPAQSMQSFMAMKVVGFDDAGTNEAYVNYWQLWLQGSDYDIDKVSLLGSTFTKDGQYVKWSPYFNFDNETTLKASQHLPYPSGVLIEDDNSYVARLNARYLAEKADTFLIDGKSKRFFNSYELILLADILRHLKNTDYIVDLDKDNSDYDKILAMVDIVNKHNMYARKKRNQKQMLMNFITYNMIDIILDPINLILSLSPIDDQADRIKRLTTRSRLAKQTDTYAPGNVESKMNAIILTLTGKDNVGIVASAMKTFEALSFYTNKALKDSLKSLTTKELKKAVDFVTLGKDGLTICGLKVLLLANSYVNPGLIKAAEQNGLKCDVLKDALNLVNNDEDAFLLISALLSLATDNAKDPTLSKINANQDIIGLYTAGTAIGIDFPRLVNTIMSETGDYLLGWISGNVFQGEEKKSLYKVILYVDEGPDMSKLNKESLQLLATAIDIYREDKKSFLKDSSDEETKEKNANEHDEIQKLKESTDSLMSGEAEKIRRELLSLAKQYGSEAIITIFRNATESTKHSYTEMLELQAEIKNKRLEFKETQEIAAHLEAQALQESLNTISTSRVTRRALENSFLEWLDYTFKSSRIKGEYINDNGETFKVWDFFRNKVRDNPYYCNKEGLAYIDPKTNEVHVLDKLTPPSEEAIEQYKKRYADWKVEWNEILKEAREKHQAEYQSYLEKLKDYEEGKTETKPRKPKSLNLKEYKDSYAVYLDALRLGTQAEPPSKPYTFKKPENRNSYEEALLARAEKCLLTMPIYPSAKDKVFINKGPVYNPFESISILSDVNSEFGTLRTILSLNQGLPSSPSEQIMLIRQFQSILLTRINAKKLSSKTKQEYASRLGGSLLLDLHKFLNDSEYRLNAIDIYNEVKVAVNVLAAAYETPHYRGYLKDLDVLIEGSKLYASVYRATLNDVEDVLQEFGYYTNKDVENTINAMGKFYVNVLNNLFLQSKNISITILPGQKYFSSDGTMQVSNTRTTIQLGTPHGNASFKLWFEEYVIPNMKKGNFGKVVEGNISYRAVPKFIKDLEMVEVDRTPTQNAYVAYSLPIDMLPHSESAIIKFKTYKNELNRMNMNIYYQTINPETGEQVQVGIPFKNLLFLYNIVAYGMENTQNAFTSIFEDMARDGSLPIQLDYNDFISLFDLRNDLVLDRDYTRRQLLYWCAPIIYNPRISTVKYGKYYDPNSLKYVLLSYNQDSEEDYQGEGGYLGNEGNEGEPRRLTALEMSKYTTETSNLPSLYYIRDFIDFQESSTMYINGNTLVEFAGHSIDKVIYGGKTYEVSDLIEEYARVVLPGRLLLPSDLIIPLENRNILGEIVKVPNRQFVEAILSEIFNPCP